MVERPHAAHSSSPVAASPGTFVLVPPGVSHGFHNKCDTPVRVLNIHAPAGFDRRIGLKDPINEGRR